MAWQIAVDVIALLGAAFSIFGGTLALIAIWLYLRPSVIITIETYEYVPGTDTRRFRLVIRNIGNVSVRLQKFEQAFRDNRPPLDWTDLAPMFENRNLPPRAEVPVWLGENDVQERKGFSITYRGWLPWELRTQARFDLSDYRVIYYVTPKPVTATLDVRVNDAIISGGNTEETG